MTTRVITGVTVENGQRTTVSFSHSRPAAIPPVDHLSKVVRCESEAQPQVVGINMVREPGQGVTVGYFEKPSTPQESPLAR